MTKRQQMDTLVQQLNEVSGEDPVVWRRVVDENGYGQNVATIGSFVIDGNIGGYRVERIENDGGGVSCPFGESRYPMGQFIQHLRTLITAFGMKK